MPLLLGSLFILLQPLIDDREIGPQDRIRLGSPGRIAKWFTPKHLSHRLPRMTGLSANLLDAFLINPVCRADIPILIHLDHPFHP